MHKILLVDDSATDRTLLKGLLSRTGLFDVESVENGREALEFLAQAPVHLVVTDMQMPEMDGLELVTAIRLRHPLIPVILITGHGSESLAAKALKRGAAGYVPKSHCHELLGDTVQHVLELSQADLDYERLLQASVHSHFDFVLDNDLSLIPPLQDLAQRMVGALGVCDHVGCLQVGIALEHALSNAILHGNLELTREQLLAVRGRPHDMQELIEDRRWKVPYCDRVVQVSIDVTRDDVAIVVQDEGPGFHVQGVSAAGLSQSLQGGAGQGLMLMWAFMDKVTFDRSGCKLTLVKHRTVRQIPLEPVSTANVATATIATAPAVKTLGTLIAKDDSSHFLLTKERVTIGRGESCDVVIPRSTISHHHCILYIHEGWWFVKDLQSTNGTKVNHIATKEHLLRPGNTLSLGSQDFLIDYQPHDLGAIGITPPVDPF